MEIVRCEITYRKKGIVLTMPYFGTGLCPVDKIAEYVKQNVKELKKDWAILRKRKQFKFKFSSDRRSRISVPM